MFQFTILQIRRKLLKKIIITMVAIAFPLSAYSDITELETSKGITAYCVNGHVFISSQDDGLVQMMTAQGVYNQILKPMLCLEYMAQM